jgi:alanyl-tRNA synthetase
MTEKLYYSDAYIKEFTATVVEVVTDKRGVAAVLDRTAFFPEEGGQSADTGFISSSRVIDVRERDGVIYHYIDEPIGVGTSVSCSIDFAERFEKMQCHTAEHIISGAIKRLFGLDNVGFHLGATEVTMDVNGYVTREQLDEIELIANRAVFENADVRATFPSPEELASIPYRSKLDLTENVRIVEIVGYDLCACCAPHVARTGEIGLIKILDFEKHRGGTRICIAAGYRALRDYRVKYANIQRASALFSEPQATVAAAAESFLSSYEELKSRFKQTRLALARLEAERIPATDGSIVRLYPDFTPDELREVVNYAKHKVGGILMALSGTDGDFKVVMSSTSVDLSQTAKRIFTDLGGRGGGRDNMVQGSLSATLAQISDYLEQSSFI